MTPRRHFDPLRPNRVTGAPERYEFTHGTESVCVYDIRTLDFIKEIPAGTRPDCHSTSLDNRFLYMACGNGLYCIDQDSLTFARVIDTGHVYGTNVMPDGDTMLLHDAFGGVYILKNIQDMDRIHIHKRIDVLKTDTPMDTLGGKGHFIDRDCRYYLCCGWEHSKLVVIDLQRDYTFGDFLEYDSRLWRGDDLAVNADKTKAYAACHREGEPSHVAVIDLKARRVVKTVTTGRGTCGMTMTNDECYVVVSNDADDSISVIDTETDELAATVSARAGFEKLGIKGYIQGISIGQRDEVYVYDCSGNGALVRFSDITRAGKWEISYPGGRAEGISD